MKKFRDLDLGLVNQFIGEENIISCLIEHDNSSKIIDMEKVNKSYESYDYFISKLLLYMSTLAISDKKFSHNLSSILKCMEVNLGEYCYDDFFHIDPFDYFNSLDMFDFDIHGHPATTFSEFKDFVNKYGHKILPYLIKESFLDGGFDLICDDYDLNYEYTTITISSNNIHSYISQNINNKEKLDELIDITTTLIDCISPYQECFSIPTITLKPSNDTTSRVYCLEYGVAEYLDTYTNINLDFFMNAKNNLEKFNNLVNMDF